jgi:hypothetical protein
MSKLTDYLIAHLGANSSDQAGSGATSPGAEWRDDEGDQQSRYRPRTYPYHDYLPYPVEDEAERQAHLNEIVKNLYIAIEARDFTPGAVRWSRELRGWLSLKFDPPRKTRAKLVKLYYELAMSPGLGSAVAERFSNMFMVLTKYISRSSLVFLLLLSHSAYTAMEHNYNPLFVCDKRMLRSFKGGNTIYIQEKTCYWIGNRFTRIFYQLCYHQIQESAISPRKRMCAC